MSKYLFVEIFLMDLSAPLQSAVQIFRQLNACWMTILACMLLLPSQLMAMAFDDTSPWDFVPNGPDAAAGGWYINLGITGARAKILRSNLKSLTIMYVFPNTPAAGKLQVGDRIIGVNNRPFATPAAFDYGDKSNEGPLMDFGNALEESQSTLMGQLTLSVVRGTAEIKVVLNIGTRYGAYNGGFPSSNCPKTDLILSELYPYLVRNESEWIGRTEVGWMAALALLASGDKQYLPVVKRAAQKMAQDTHRNVTADDMDGLSVWHNTLAGIVLSEYYLATKESWVLPELEEIRDWLMATQFMNAATQVRNKFAEYGAKELQNSLGGWGHNPGFEGYGPMSVTTAQAAMALSLMRECGITVDRARLDKALDYCAIATSPTGFVGYEAAWGQNDGNDGTDKGRDGAVCLANYLCTYTDAKYQQRAQLISTQVGTNLNYFPDTHASPVIGMIWHAAAAKVRPEGFANLLNNFKWWFNLAHNTDGTFGYQPNRDNTAEGNLRIHMTPVIALLFSLNKKNLRISGANQRTLSLSNVPLATPNPANAGSVVQFTVAASGNDPLTYRWDFGDGSIAVGATVLHSYTAPGSYTVKVNVSDASGHSATGSLQMTVASSGDDTDGDGVPNGLDDDDDNDGVSDQNEVADGTDPLNPTSANKLPFELLKFGGSAKFNATGKDSCSISGMLSAISAGFNPLGVVVKIDVGGATRNFTLDAKGRAKATDGSFGLKLKLVTNKTTKKKEFLGGSVPFKAKISKGSWMDEWADEGVDPASSAAKKPIPMVVDITLGGRVYTHAASVIYSSKAAVGGKFKK